MNGRLEELLGPVSRETTARLDAFRKLFDRWAERINLVGPSTRPDFWERHVIDSAQLLRLKPGALRWLDLGSGGGFPGLVLAILLDRRPGTMVQLVDSNAKKAAFLTAAVAELGLGARIHRCRIEAARDVTGPTEIVTARALSPLAPLLALASPWLLKGATGLFHKGRDFLGEIDKARDGWRFDLIEHHSVVEPDARILEIGNLSRAQHQNM